MKRLLHQIILGVGVYWLFMPSLAFGQAVIIDDAWLAARVSPYYLDQAGKTYLLARNVSTSGTAFVIVAANIVLDLQGHTITYDNDPQVVVANGGFEQGAGPVPSSWEVSSAADAKRAAGTMVQPVSVFEGSYAVRFDTPVADQYLRSSGSVQLQANKNYLLTAAFYNNNYASGQNGSAVTLYVKFEGSSAEAALSGIGWRGFAYIAVPYTTGPQPETRRILAGIRGADASSGAVFIDDVEIHGTRPHGVAVGPLSWEANNYPDITSFGNATGSIVRNGYIVQGPGNSDRAHGITLGAQNHDIELTGLTVRVYGPNARNIQVDEFSNRMNIHDNTFYNDVTVISVRDHLDGTVIMNDQNTSDSVIHHNTIIGGSQGGIGITAKSGFPADIHENTISLRTRFTNGFAIFGAYNLIHNNIIRCDYGEFSCRGIYGDTGTKIYGNLVYVRDLPRIQEYNGCEIGGSYGLQIEPAVGAEVYGNEITAYADSCDSAAFRANPQSEGGGGTNLQVYDNVFSAVKRGSASAYTVKLDEILDAVTTLNLHNNVLITNSKWLVGADLKDLEFRANTLALGQNLEQPFRPLAANYWPADAEHAIRDIRFIDNRYATEAARTAFSEAAVYYGSTVDSRSSYYNSAFLTVLVKNGAAAVDGAQIAVRDRNNAEVWQGTADSTGRAETTLSEYRMAGGTKTEQSPYTVEASAAGLGARSAQVTLDRSKTLVVNFGTNQPPQVEAGADQSLRMSNAAMLHGTIADEDEPKTILWSKVSGPGTVTFGNSSGVDTSAMVSAVGTYVIRLSVTDQADQSAADELTLHVSADALPPAAPSFLRVQ